MRKYLVFVLLFVVIIPLSVRGMVYQCGYSKMWVRPGGVVPFRVQIILPSGTRFVEVSTNNSHPDLEFGVNSPTTGHTSEGLQKIEVTGNLQIFTISNIRFGGIRVVLSNAGGVIRRVLGAAVFTVVPPPINTKKKPPILPLKGPLDYPTSYTVPLFISVLIVLAVIGIFIYFRRRSKLQPAVLPGMQDVIDPWDLVQRRLAMLRETELHEEQEICDFYFQLTETVRMYLTGRSRLPFEETTTAELGRMLQRVNWINDDAAATMEHLFQDADLVKFARFIPNPDSITSFFDHIRIWLEDMDAEFRRFSTIMKSGERRGETDA